MVRHATATAVSASISTPVWPATLTRARTLIPGSFTSGASSIATSESASGWHSGMSSCVRLAAMMPAMRATESTSPFLALPLRTMSSVERRIMTRPSASASRSVVGFDDTSTMRAAPRAPRWESRGRGGMSLSGAAAQAPVRDRRGVARGARQQRARGVCNVVLPHQAFANKKSRHPGGGEAGKSGRSENAALADNDAAGRHELRQPLGCGERRLEGLEITIVDANQPGFEAQGALKFRFVMDLHQHIHAERCSGAFELGRASVIDRSHDDQDAIGAGGTRLGHLVRIVHEVLAQDRQRAGGARDAQIVERTLKGGRISQH